MPRRAAACLGEQTRRLGDQMVDAESTPRIIDVVKLRGSRNLLVLRELYCTKMVTCAFYLIGGICHRKKIYKRLYPGLSAPVSLPISQPLDFGL
ncbi:hypothetical protein DPMN_046639 [Dreissena polymorpha]|uniref:Uncharacterized protein n=1 Tax=Dreissena polymorpha TaxID=45954 RepID=A0A9D4D888_DREPO|nr:hypothetical protein DPMN_046639 [Dreissena polymorpha]